MPTALVLSAGGMFAAWEVGVWKALRETFTPDVIVGASAGAWIGWSIAGGASAEELERQWRDPETARIMQVGFHRTGFLRPERLHAKAKELVGRYKPGMPFGLTIVEMPGLRVHLARDGEIEWEHLAATCSIPFAFPPVRIGGKSYVDGGFLGALPLWAAEEMGATRAVALNCLTTLPFRALRAVMRPKRKPSPRLDVWMIEPSVGLGSVREAGVWSAANVDRWMALGERDGRAAIAAGWKWANP